MRLQVTYPPILRSFSRWVRQSMCGPCLQGSAEPAASGPGDGSQHFHSRERRTSVPSSFCASLRKFRAWVSATWLVGRPPVSVPDSARELGPLGTSGTGRGWHRADSSGGAAGARAGARAATPTTQRLQSDGARRRSCGCCQERSLLQGVAVGTRGPQSQGGNRN